MAASLYHRATRPRVIACAVMVIGNLVGFVMLIVAGAVGSGVVHLFGGMREAAILVAACPVMALLDIAYRRYRKSTAFGAAGGRLFFLPVWLISLVLLAVGIGTLVRGQ